jgi:hypothetical protein
MTITKKSLATTALLGLLALGIARASDEPKPAAKVIPYPLKTCLVSDGKLGEMGTPYVFTNANREIKLCCTNCLKDFNKDTAKFTKKLEDAEKKK